MEGFKKLVEYFDDKAAEYDQCMLSDVKLSEFYDEIELYIPKKDKIKVLDLGCGTGLQTERIFKVNPDAEVCGIDLSANMLEVFKEKFKDKHINLICGSYFDVDFGKEIYDFAISTYSFHHFYRETKLNLYKKIYNSLKNGGVFVEGDIVTRSVQKERCFLEELAKIGEEGIYHYDIPMYFESQFNLYGEAGFGKVEVKRNWDYTRIFVCEKENDL